MSGLPAGPTSKAHKPSNSTLAVSVSRSRRMLSMNSGASGLSPMEKTSRVIGSSISGRPGRAFSPT